MSMILIIIFIIILKKICIIIIHLKHTRNKNLNGIENIIEKDNTKFNDNNYLTSKITC